VAGSPFVIAEAGVNHNGKLDLALQLVDAAAHAKADAVKFQTFRADAIVTRAAPKAAYQERAPVDEASQLEMLKNLELDLAAHRAIAKRCSERGIEFMSTPFDLESVAMLDELGVRRFKVPSGELTNPPLLRAVARTGKPLIVSTGMATLGDVELALSVLARELAPELGENALWNPKAQDILRARVTLLHCTTEYPAPPEAANLRAMATLASAFGLPVGYSDHTEGPAISIAAVALGAVVIEKHITLDRTMRGPDHAASLETKDLAEFVRSLRAACAALGDGRKVPQPAEIGNRAIARRSLVAKRSIARGEAYSPENLTLKRPGTGVPSSQWDAMIGRPANRAYAPDELIDPS
jgi:N-acetylneuraminate synthase